MARYEFIFYRRDGKIELEKEKIPVLWWMVFFAAVIGATFLSLFEVMPVRWALTLAIGGTGVISVVSNIVPRDVRDMVSKFKNGDVDGARKLHYKLLPLVKAMFIETNPIPVKTAMALLGMIDESSLRLPMCAMSDANLTQLKKALKDYGLM